MINKYRQILNYINTELLDKEKSFQINALSKLQENKKNLPPVMGGLLNNIIYEKNPEFFKYIAKKCSDLATSNSPDQIIGFMKTIQELVYGNPAKGKFSETTLKLLAEFEIDQHNKEETKPKDQV